MTDPSAPGPGVRDYLFRFGYLTARDANPGQLAKALWGFQRLHRLPLTGVADVMTLGMMHQPRCGLPDHEVPGALPRLWSVRRLVCAVANGTSTLTTRDVTGALAEAISYWQPDLPFTVAVGPASREAEVVVRFHRGEHGDGCELGGEPRVLGHAFLLAGRGGRLVGEIHLDADVRWSLEPGVDTAAPDLVAAFSHQLGHILGLGHATSPGTVMHPIHRWVQRHPARQDFAALRALQHTRPGLLRRLSRILGAG